MRANRYNIDHNRPGMRQAPWRDRYVTRVLARPLQPRAPQLFSSRYCCATCDPVTSTRQLKSVVCLYIIFQPSPVICHLSSVIMSSVILSSTIYHLSSVICHLPSATPMLHAPCSMLDASCFMLHASCSSSFFMLYASCFGFRETSSCFMLVDA
jgi:hypothetical protein